MRQDSFYHTLENGENAKFTIYETIKVREIVYFAKVVSTDIDFYKNLSEKKKEEFHGVEIKDEYGITVFYKNPEKLKLDIIAFYGKKRLKSEI